MDCCGSGGLRRFWERLASLLAAAIVVGFVVLAAARYVRDVQVETSPEPVTTQDHEGG